MSHTPLSKKQKVVSDEERITPNQNEQDNDKTHPEVTASSFLKSHTPRKLLLGSADNKYVLSQPIISSSSHGSSSLQVPNLQPPLSQPSRGRDKKAYSQSPPRSPGRSPVRKLELIQLSPIKNNRIELQKLYNSKNQNKVRLYIDKLVLQDFKSYAGTQIVGPFNTSFSAIVGPNGSGKSNVIDSMLFVFGFRANKMRQDRLGDLIHKSEAFPNIQSCSVEVHFQYVIDENDGTSKIIEDRKPLVVMRKAFKNNSSKYYINGKESNYTEVTRLLKEEGIDLDHKRFLILQGEVENIAQMKAKAEKEGDDGLLEYLEDIIGTSKYKTLIEDKMVEIEALNEICVEKEKRFEIVETEKNSLESDKDAALEFIAKEKQLTLLRSKLTQYKLYQTNTKLATTLDKISNFKNALQEERSKYEKIQSEIDQSTRELREANEKINASVAQERELVQKKREYDGQCVSMEERIKNLTQKKTKAEKTLHDKRIEIQKNESILKDLQDYQMNYDSEFSNLQKELDKERSKLDDIKLSLKDKTKDISSQISLYEKDIEPWVSKIQEKQVQIQLAESEISLLKESQAKLKEGLGSLKVEIDDVRKEIDNKNSIIENLKKEQVSLKKEVSLGESECSRAKEKEKEMRVILNSHRQRAIDARSALHMAENKSTVLSALTRLQKSGRINGFHGRLGDLGVIADKYDIAISTACSRLDDIVVDSVECGQQCIEYLRKNKLGYARFILLDKLRNFQLGQLQTPENVLRLFDLVQPIDLKFSNAFYSVLRDTLVATDIRQANRVAYGKRRYRVVTLDGKLIDISGTMTGGGSHVSKGLMKLKNSNMEHLEVYEAGDVEKIERDLAERENNFKIAHDTLQEMNNELKRLQDKEPEIELEIAKLLMDVDSLNDQLNLKEQQLKELEKNYTDVINKKDPLDRAEAFLQTLRNEHRALEDQSQSKKEKINTLKEEIMKIGGKELQIQNSKVSSLTERIGIVNAKHKKDKATIKRTEKELQKVQRLFKQAELDNTACVNDLETLQTNVIAIRTRLQETEAEFDIILNEKDDLTGQCESLKEKIKDMEESMNEYKSFEIEIKNKLEKLNSLLDYCKKDIRSLNQELQSYHVRDVTQSLEKIQNENANNSVGVKQSSNNLDVSSSHTPNVDKHDDEISMEDADNDSQNEIEEKEQDADIMDLDNVTEEVSKGIPKLTDDDLKSIDLDSLESEINQLQDYVENSNADIELLEEYIRRLEEFKKRKLDLNTTVARRDEVRDELEKLKKTRHDEFMEGFSIISLTLKEMYQMITMGGNAELELVDSLDPFSEGVTFSVMPPKKSWRNITNLSGGEKTLSSLALVFALHKYKPTPLYVMDEIDAALDFRNVSIVANYIKERTKNAQFIVISLRNNMFELAQQLVGIYKRSNMTQSATLKNKDILNC
ncbi:hypothetical protein KAFR_0B02710 [Kazachstania africana CBS 2517]|uniref:Structural maintenance of chromosomes protein n=1 Tax=Kazachstania africana (strain ATCC 22294 / BCRC 22015 / CBS 2517 / CECT 1963 / NBRC 1671 / NRRL Y-8276) TaxID=1071382 RepID=H2AQB8_KAZAF|nr:hypothetical protein KAFR_0B02710 [Kazachstania africana CBS 2517]CCF56568.1 hypothetical protein KAFR_0B02710 [Kazachstania africana CBS 2517]